MNEYITIPLSKLGKYRGEYSALISKEDEILCSSNWCVSDNGTLLYAKRREKECYLHRAVMERVLGHPLSQDTIIDHVNGNPLDNRRENLRLATYSQNMANSKLRSDNTTGFKGVSWSKQKGKFRAYIWFEKKLYHVGFFNTAEEASEARQIKAIELHKEFARLK